MARQAAEPAGAPVRDQSYFVLGANDAPHSALLLTGFSSRVHDVRSYGQLPRDWQLHVASQVDDGLQLWLRRSWDVVLVDLVGSESSEWGLRRTSEEIVTFYPGLWAVIGHRDEPAEELWARQLGAWLYLPTGHHPVPWDWIVRQADEILTHGVHRIARHSASNDLATCAVWSGN